MQFEDLIKVIDDLQIVSLNINGETITGRAFALGAYVCETVSKGDVINAIVEGDTLKIWVKE